MAKTITASYTSKDAARNALDELVADGIDREKCFLDEEHNAIKVLIPNVIEREITEILNRHNPTAVS